MWCGEAMPEQRPEARDKAQGETMSGTGGSGSGREQDEAARGDAAGYAAAGPWIRRLLAPSAIALVLANLVPLYGVLVLKWEVFPLVFLYWLENVTVGGFTVLRMLVNRTDEPLKLVQKAFMIPFFMVHYGMFTMFHGFFVFVLFGDGLSGDIDNMTFNLVLKIIWEYKLLGPAVAVVASHAFSFADNYLGKGEYRQFFLVEEMFRPYRRIVVLHLTIIGGGFLIQFLGAPALALVLLVLLKTGVDAVSHSRSHQRKERLMRRRMQRLYERAKAPVDESLPDSLAAQYPGYVRDREFEKRTNRVPTAFAIAWLATGAVAVALILAEQRTPAIAVGVLSAASLVTSIVLYNIRRKIACRECGRAMEVVETLAKMHELKPTQRLSAGASGSRVEQRWYVCHDCRKYIRARLLIQNPQS